MMTIRANDLHTRFREICNAVLDGDTVIVARPRNENIVLVSETEFNAMMKAKRNAEYLQKLEVSRQQLREGKTVEISVDEMDELSK